LKGTSSYEASDGREQSTKYSNRTAKKVADSSIRAKKVLIALKPGWDRRDKVEIPP
jgi:hypothetical protein